MNILYDKFNYMDKTFQFQFNKNHVRVFISLKNHKIKRSVSRAHQI